MELFAQIIQVLSLLLVMLSFILIAIGAIYLTTESVNRIEYNKKRCVLKLILISFLKFSYVVGLWAINPVVGFVVLLTIIILSEVEMYRLKRK